MSDTALIELVDTEILAVRGEGPLLRAPGYALLEDGGIETGAAALAKAWLYPQRSFNQFWRQLTLAPLPASHRHARHYADLAFAQLRQIHTDLGAPDQMLFALPGNFSRDQLSILLGLANALPATTLGMVDTAVAAASSLAHAGDVLHLDIQLHQTVVTHLRVDDQVKRVAVEILPDTGVKAFHNAWAQYIADQFIQQYRYDPLHQARDEQQLHDRLPSWLEALTHDDQVSAELATGRGDFHLMLTRSALAAHTAERVSRLRQALDKFPRGALRVASYRLERLPGVGEALGLQMLKEQQTLDGCRALLPLLASQGSVSFVTELPRRVEAPGRPSDVAATTRAPSHLLLRGCAYAIREGIGVARVGGEFAVTRNRQEALVWLDPSLRLESMPGATVDIKSAGDRLTTGDRFSLDGEPLSLIEVRTES